MIDGK